MVVANDDSTLGSYLDVDSSTLGETQPNSTNFTVDVIPKAILWNHGFGAPEMVVRSADALANHTNNPSPLEQGLLDAAKTLDNGNRMQVSGVSSLKHGNIVALACISSTGTNSYVAFLRMRNGTVDFGGGYRTSATDLPRNFCFERFLVVQRGDKFAFYSIENNTYIREYKNSLDGLGGDVHTDPPRHCELFTIEAIPRKPAAISLRKPSGKYLYYGYGQRNYGETASQPKDCWFSVVVLSDSFSSTT